MMMKGLEIRRVFLMVPSCRTRQAYKPREGVAHPMSISLQVDWLLFAFDQQLISPCADLEGGSGGPDPPGICKA